ncbi:hypothetical protein EJ08DRAFT_594197, partial [Tothia fuscella]
TLSAMSITLYPKITNKLVSVRHALLQSGNITDSPLNGDVTDPTYTPSTLPIVGTVKLHGAHADIVIDAQDNVKFQSRNRTDLSIASDNHNFAATMSNHVPAILRIRDRYYERFRALNPGTPIDKSFPLIIAGEWIGSKIQRRVAIAKLTHRFVIVSASINGSWLPDEPYGDIHNEEDLIYQISRSGFFHATLNFNFLNTTLKELDEITAVVEKECPFAATFDIKGPGEGIVWKLTDHPNIPDTWFKVKGENFDPTTKKPTDPAILAERENQRGPLNAFVEDVVTEVRLEQGWDYLREMGIKRDYKAIASFLRWVNEDAATEEKEEVQELEKVGVKWKDIEKAIQTAARRWYQKKMREGAGDCDERAGNSLDMKEVKDEISKIETS